MSDGAHGGRREPRQAEQRTDGTQDDDEQEIQVEAWAFDQATLLLADDQSDGSEENMGNDFKKLKFSEQKTSIRRL